MDAHTLRVHVSRLVGVQYYTRRGAGGLIAGVGVVIRFGLRIEEGHGTKPKQEPDDNARSRATMIVVATASATPTHIATTTTLASVSFPS